MSRFSFRILQSSTDSRVVRQWGLTDDKKVPADYDGDGKADLAVFRYDYFSDNGEAGIWFILQSSNGAVRVERFGLPTDRLVPADYDGDGKADIAVYRPSDGFWYRLNSRDGSFMQCNLELQPINQHLPITTETEKPTLRCSALQPVHGICNAQEKVLRRTSLDSGMTFRYRMFMFVNYFSN
ncbi:MAG: VCBS repeat-containing protein [Pyrinomonadaceae bacterium]